MKGHGLFWGCGIGWPQSLPNHETAEFPRMDRPPREHAADVSEHEAGELNPPASAQAVLHGRGSIRTCGSIGERGPNRAFSDLPYRTDNCQRIPAVCRIFLATYA